MKARPILFSAEMVRALLDGRKTQTRRVIKPQPPEEYPVARLSDGVCVWSKHKESEFPMWARHSVCHYGKPGDLLWVRETWTKGRANFLGTTYDVPTWRTKNGAIGPILYRCSDIYEGHANFIKWRPSIHMPRWASRLTLRITDIRVERLQEISEADAVAEGVQPHEYAIGPLGVRADSIRCIHCGKLRSDHVGQAMVCFGGNGTCWNGNTARGGFGVLWDSINSNRGYSWDMNPWVWVIEFNVINKNVDEVIK